MRREKIGRSVLQGPTTHIKRVDEEMSVFDLLKLAQKNVEESRKESEEAEELQHELKLEEHKGDKIQEVEEKSKKQLEKEDDNQK